MAHSPRLAARGTTSATGCQASRNWPFNREDLEVYGDHGLAIATGGNGLRIGLPREPEHAVTPEPRAADERDSISHLMAVVRGKRTPNGLSSLANNMIVTEILEAARESAQTHKTVAFERESILVERSPTRD